MNTINAKKAVKGPLISSAIWDAYRENHELIDRIDNLKNYSPEKLEEIKVLASDLSSNLYHLANSDDEFFTSPYLRKADILLGRTYIRRSAKTLQRCCHLIFQAKKNPSEAKAYLALVKLHLSQNLSSIIYLFKYNKLEIMISEVDKGKGVMVKPTSLQKGDLLLSYKTKEFLRNHWISYAISIAEYNPITHSMMVTKSGKKPQALVASGYENFLGVAEVSRKEGEVLFVFRPKLNKATKKKVLANLDSWCEKSKDGYSFSKLKVWFAIFDGWLFRVIDATTRHIVIIPNPFRQKKKYYCSELINEIFLQAGVYLCPRSKYSSLVGPSEIACSPFLECKGVLSIPAQGK